MHLTPVPLCAYCSDMNSATPSGTVAANVRAELARRGGNVQSLSEGLQQHRVTVGRGLRGQRPFTIDEIVAIADFLDIPLSTLLVGVGREQAKTSA